MLVNILFALAVAGPAQSQNTLDEKYNTTFDDLKSGPNVQIGSYNGLFWKGFQAYEIPSYKPHSAPNIAYTAPPRNTGPALQLTPSQPTTSFDLKSLWFACVSYSEGRPNAFPVACNIMLNGTSTVQKVAPVIQTFHYDQSDFSNGMRLALLKPLFGNNNITNIAVSFKNTDSPKASALLVDNVLYTTHQTSDLG